MANDYVSSDYVQPSQTSTNQARSSETKKFLKNALPAEDTRLYGQSKPRRIVIKAKVSHGRG